MSGPSSTARRLAQLAIAVPSYTPPRGPNEVRLDDEDGAGRDALDRLRTDVDRLLDPTRVNPSGRLSKTSVAMVKGGRESMAVALGEHRLNVLTRGIGTYYGSMSIMTWLQKSEDWLLDRVGVDAELPVLVQSDCIQYALQHVGAAYGEAGKEARFETILKRVEQRGMRATALAVELQKDGWEAVYFNPDTAKAHDKKDPDGAIHAQSVELVLEKKSAYYGLKVRHLVIDYRNKAEPDTEGLDALRRVPFFFGLARAGSHAFVGYDGRVQELHWDKAPNDPKVIDETPLERFPWESGILMIPPKSWPLKDC